MIEEYPNSAALFKNDRKTSKDPVYSGEGKVTCPHCQKTVLFKMASWIRVAKKSGSKFMSITITPESSADLDSEFDDDIPF